VIPFDEGGQVVHALRRWYGHRDPTAPARANPVRTDCSSADPFSAPPERRICLAVVVVEMVSENNDGAWKADDWVHQLSLALGTCNGVALERRHDPSGPPECLSPARAFRICLTSSDAGATYFAHCLYITISRKSWSLTSLSCCLVDSVGRLPPRTETSPSLAVTEGGNAELLSYLQIVYRIRHAFDQWM
jgi:hypothetical protein